MFGDMPKRRRRRRRREKKKKKKKMVGNIEGMFGFHLWLQSERERRFGGRSRDIRRLAASRRSTALDRLPVSSCHPLYSDHWLSLTSRENQRNFHFYFYRYFIPI